MNLSTCSALSLTALLLLASACDSTAVADGEPDIKVIPVSSAADISLPALRYAPTPEDEHAYFAAVRVAKEKCASSYGVESTEPSSDQPTWSELNSERRYGLIDPDEVARYGYRPPSIPGQDDEKGGPSRWNPSQRELLIMQGQTPDGEAVDVDPVTGRQLPEHGCSSEAFRSLVDDDTSPAQNPVAEEILMQAWDLLLNDSRAVGAEKDWSACMATRGYDFTHRWEAGNSTAGKSQKVARTVAKADMACAEETDYIEVWYAVDVAYQNKLIADHEGELEAIRAGHEEVMQRVRETLAGSGA